MDVSIACPGPVRPAAQRSGSSVRSGNYCCSSIRVASIDENKNGHRKITMNLFTIPSARAGYDTKAIFKRSLTGLNLEFSFSWTSCLTKAEGPSLPYYLLKAGERIIGFIPFPRVLVLCEMQSVLSRIWTRVAVSISYDDNIYTTGTSKDNHDPHSNIIAWLNVELIFSMPQSIFFSTLSHFMVGNIDTHTHTHTHTHMYLYRHDSC